MPAVKLLSNGTYHVMVTSEGSGYSRRNGLALTRWREDATLDDGGAYFYLRDADDGALWSATQRPVRAPPAAVATRFDAGTAAFSRRDHEIEVTTTLAVAADAEVELRRLRIANLASRRRSLEVTSFAEIVLAAAADDAAHPAFSKMFVETEFDPALGAIVATRRPSGSGDEAASWLFHTAVVPDGGSGISYETDRLRFIGRGRDAAMPEALLDGEPLSGHAGPVLDAVAALRVPLVLEARGSVTIDWYTGVAATRADCIALARRFRAAGAGDLVLEQASRYREATLQRIGASAADAATYERLAGAILYADASLRGDAGVIAKNRRGQSGLWGFGISGDLPVVCLEVASAARLGVLQEVVRAQAFWRAHGIATELMVVTGTSEAAQPAWLAQVQQSAGEGLGAGHVGKPGGIFIRDAASLDEGDRTLLRSVARIVIDAEADPAAAGLAGLVGRGTPAPAPATTTATAAAPPRPPSGLALTTPGRDENLLDFNGYGGFAADRCEYVITTSASHMTPTPWINIIAGPEFGTLISESGSASTWSENAQLFRLTPWSNDPVGDANSEAFYIRDEESRRFWSPTLLPTRGPGTFVARHGFGYSRFEHSEEGIESELCVHVAIDAPVKFSTLTLRNRSDRARRLSVTGCLDWVLGDEPAKTAMQVVTELDAETGALFARNGYNTDFDGRTAFFDVEGAGRSFCGDRGDFYGAAGSRAVPAAMNEAALSGRVGAALDPCAALRVVLELAPGAQAQVSFRLGAGKNADEARALVRRWRGADAAGDALEAAKDYWRQALGAVQVRTPDAAVDTLANGWLLYQLIASRLWARTAFYQASGAFGFRDQLQDVMALVHAEPRLVRAHLLRSAARQFVEGDVQHWWHPPSGKGIRTRCSDDYLWLPFVTARYVESTGDASVLDESCHFLDSRLLKDGEQSDYEQPSVSPQSATLYEHGVRAIRHGLRYGAHGLPLMGAGDWNDGMNLVGAGGQGESVWLAFFLIAVLRRFAPLARARGDDAFAELCENEAAAVGRRVEACAWDGHWYQRAWFDDGTPLGVAANAECRIDSIAQSWSVLSGAAPADRAQTAMDSLYEHLVHRPGRLVQLLDPPFDTSKPSPGYIQGYVPGVRENGGQYTHAAVWATLAFAALGDADRAWELFALLAPVHHGASAADIATYKVEPYVVAGDVYAFPPHTGRGGWTWYTGSAGWMYQLLVESLLGLERRGNQLRVRPLLPKAWPGYEIRYRFGGSAYEIAVRPVATAGAARVSVDGIAVRDGRIALLDDGKTHAVAVDAFAERGPLAA